MSSMSRPQTQPVPELYGIDPDETRRRIGVLNGRYVSSRDFDDSRRHTIDADGDRDLTPIR